MEKPIFIALLLILCCAEDTTQTCYEPNDSLSQQICNIRSLLELYTQKLSLLTAMKSSQGGSAHLPQPRHLVAKPTNPNYTSFSWFIPPSHILSNGSLYDMNGNWLETLSGRLLAVQQGEVTTLLGKQVNIVSLKAKVSKELWGVEKDELPTIWVMIKGERAMVQWKGEVVTLSGLGMAKELQIGEEVLGVWRGVGSLVVVARRRWVKVALPSFEMTYPRELELVTIGDIVGASYDIHQPSLLCIINSKNTLFFIDLLRSTILSSTDFSYLSNRYQLSSHSVHFSHPLVFITSPNSPKILLLNSSSLPPTELPPLTLCPSLVPTTTYSHSFTSSGGSIYVMCRRRNAEQDIARLFEIVLPEKHVQELVPRWVQYVVVVVAVAVGLLWRGFKANNKKTTAIIPSGVHMPPRKGRGSVQVPKGKDTQLPQTPNPQSKPSQPPQPQQPSPSNAGKPPKKKSSPPSADPKHHKKQD